MLASNQRPEVGCGCTAVRRATGLPDPPSLPPVDRHVRLGRRLQSKASGVSENHESTPRYAPDCADFGEFSELLERATQDLETVFFLFEERVEQR